MRSRTPTKRPLHPALAALLALAVLALGGTGTIGILAYFGVVDLSRWFHKPIENPYAGKIAVPASGTQIPAYAAVTREHLFEGNTQTIKLLYMRPEEVQPGWIVDLSKILGRVMSRDKPEGRVFVEADFLPKGTRSGLVGGIPPGKLALTVDAEQVQGLKELHIGDRFDLVSTQALDMKGIQPQVRWKTSGKSSILNVGSGSYSDNKTKVAVLVHNGSVVTHPVVAKAANSPQPQSGMARLTGADPGGSNRNKDSKLMTIALDPEEVGPVTEALGAKATLFCLARSGSPNEKGDAKIREIDPLENVSVIETMRGRNFGMEAFPKDGGEPQTKATADAAPGERDIPTSNSTQPQKSLTRPAVINSSSKITEFQGG